MYEQEVRDWLRSNYTGQQNIDEIEITPELKRRYIRHLTTPGIKPEDVNTELTTTEKIAQSAPVKFAGDLGAGTMQGLSGAVKGADWISGLMGVRPQLPPELEAQRPSTVKDITDLLARQYAKSSEMGFDEGSIPKYVSQGLGHAAVSVPLMSAVGIVPYSMATGGGEAAAEGKSDIGQFANAAYSGAIGLVQDRILHGIGKKELSVIPRQLLGGAAMAGVPIVAETAMKIQQGQDPTDIDWKKVTADFIQGALFPLGSKKKSPTYKDRAAELAELQKQAEIEFGVPKPTKLEDTPGPTVVSPTGESNVSRPPVSSVESLKKDGSGGISEPGSSDTIKIRRYTKDVNKQLDNRPTSFFDINNMKDSGIDTPESMKLLGKTKYVDMEIPKEKIYTGGNPEIDALISKSPDFVMDTNQYGREKWLRTDRRIAETLESNGYVGFKYPTGHKLANEVVILNPKELSEPVSGPRVIGQGEGGNVPRPPVPSIESVKKEVSGGISVAKPREPWEMGRQELKKTNPIPSANDGVYVFRQVSGGELKNVLSGKTDTGAFWGSYVDPPPTRGEFILVSETTGGNVRWAGLPARKFLETLPAGGKNPEFVRPPTVKDHRFHQLKERNRGEIIKILDAETGKDITPEVLKDYPDLVKAEPVSGPREYVAVGDRKQHKVKVVDEQPQVNAGDPLLGEGLVTETKKINDVSARELHGNGRTVIKSISNTSKEKGAGTDFMIGELRSEHAKGNTVVSDSFATSKQAYDMYRKINEAHGPNSAAPEFDLRIVGKNESGGDRVEIFKIGDKRAEQFQPFEKTVKAEAPTPPTMNKRPTPEAVRPVDMAAQPDSLPPQEMMPDGMKIRQTATNTLFKEHGSRIMDMLGPEKFYPPETIEGWINEANKRMTTDGTDAAIKRLMEKPQFDHLDNVEAMIISGELNKANTPEAAQSMTDLAIKQAQMGTETGRALAAMRAIDVLNAPATVAARIFREAQKRFGKKAPELTPELTKKLMQMAEEAAKMPDGGERDVAIGRILAEIQGRVPRTMWKKLSTVQAISQLLNAKTFIRNLIGNVGLNAGEVVSHYIGMPIDAALAKVTGNRSVALPKFNKYVNEFVNGLKQGVRDVSRGVNTARSNLERRTGIKIPNELKNAFEFSAGETFKGNTIWGKLEKAVGYSLQASDRAFFEARFWDSADNIMRATKTNKFTPEIVEQALHEASRVTFRDANTVSNVLVAVKNALNKVGSKGGEFGLGELVLKYPKVPGAIIKRGIEYSPFGIFESAFKTGRVLKAGNKASMADQRSAALSSARTIIGTALAALGYGLAKAGAASGDRPDNQKLAKFEEAIGKRPYSIKSGKGWFSYDWLQPLATPFTMGVAVAERKEADRRGQSILRQIANYLPDMMASAGSSITEQPVMTGISRFASGDRYGENSGFTGGLINAIAGAPSSFTPTIFGQIAATIDPKKRKIPKDFSGRMLALVANRVPFLSKTLSERKSVLGEDLKRGTGNVLADAALNLVSPAIYSKIKDDPNVDFISQLYSETKDTNVLPRQAQRTITHKNKVYELTEDQQMELQGRVAELALERLSKMISGINFDSISKEGKIRIAKRVYDYAGSTAREEMLKIMKRNEINELLESSQ